MKPGRADRRQAAGGAPDHARESRSKRHPPPDGGRLAPSPLHPFTPACPPADHLARLLDDSLPPADEAALSLHLESCSLCVQALEHLTAPAAAPLPLTVSLRSERPAVPRSGLSRLRDLLPLTVSQPHEPVPPNADLPVIPGYEIEREIGRGGMGVVYLARQTELNRPVALKMTLAGRHATTEQVIRFLAEAQTCAGLRHENIVPVYEVGRYDGLPFYAMEYVPGGTLAERARRTPFTPRDAAAVVEQLARAMHAAHARGVVHRDLKPVNVLLREREGAAPVPLVTDFGLAKHFDGGAGLTQTGAFLGTPDYMAPEQLDPAAAVGPGVDVHALGAVLYFLLAGRPPFAAVTQLDTLDQVRRAEPVSPATYARGVPRDLAVVCLRCLQKNPARRYASAEALADDLRHFLAGEPIAARRVTEMERVWKWATRNPAVAGLAATLAGVVLVALVLVSWQWYAAEGARGREAERANAEAGAKQAEAKARREAQVITAGYALDQGTAECRAGDVRAGLLQMVRALELLPPEEPDMEFAIRANIGAWRERRCPETVGPHHGTPVVSVAFSPDGGGELTGNWGNHNGDPGPAKIQLWDAARFGGEPRWTTGHPVAETKNRFKAVWSVAFSPDGTRVAVGGFDDTARVLDGASGRDRFPPLPHPGWVYGVAFSPDGNTLAVGGAVNDPTQPPTGAGELRLWNAHTGAALGPAVQLPVRVQALAWHPDGRTLAVGGTDSAKAGTGAGGAVLFFDASRAAVMPLTLPHGDTVSAVGFHPNGKTLATGCRDGLVRFWNMPEAKLMPKLLRHADPLTGLRFSATGDMLATSAGHHEPGVRAGTGTVRVWDTETATLLVAPHFDPAPGQSQKMHAVAFGAGDRKLAAVSEHGKAHLWELPPPNRPRLDLTFDAWADLFPSPGGHTLALRLMPPLARGFNNEPTTVALLDPADGTVRAILPHPVVVRVVFSRDGRRLFTFTHAGAREPRVRLWHDAPPAGCDGAHGAGASGSAGSTRRRAGRGDGRRHGRPCVAR